MDGLTDKHAASLEERRRRGGPRTAAGKRVSSANALKHGLTSKKLLPEILRADRVNALRAQLQAEHEPDTPTEHLLVDEIARHGAMLEVSEHAEPAVLRHGATELSHFLPAEGQSPHDREAADGLLAAAVATDTLERFSRYRRGHEKGFYTALNKLRELKKNREAGRAAAQQHHPNHLDRMLERFRTAAACENFLEQRVLQPDWCCPHCGHNQGSWLSARKRWECGRCGKQVGLRHGYEAYVQAIVENHSELQTSAEPR